MKKPCKVLCLFDYKSHTGFATVSHNIKIELKKHFGKDLQLDIVGINYFGEPITEDDGTYIISAVKSAPKKDDFGRLGFLKILKESNEYDGIFIIQDLGIILPIIPVLKYIKEEKKREGKKIFKSMFYFPVDCPLIDKLVENLEFFDTIVTYTDYARNQVLRLRPELKGKIKVIPHGTNTKQFYPLSNQDKLNFRKEYFGNNANKIIFTNVNRNQPRKDIPTTIFAFIEAIKNWDAEKYGRDLFLNLHCHPKDPMGWDIRSLFLHTDLVENTHYKLLDNDIANNGASVEMLNKIYNASDVYVTTTLGEGWGLCLHQLTKIIISNGVKDIKDVVVDDMVLGNDGCYHKVLDITYRKVDSLLHLKAKYGYNVKATHEHPYYVLSEGKECWKRVDELKKEDFVGIVKPIGDKKIPLCIDLADYIPKVDGWVVEDLNIYHKLGYSPKNKDWSYTTICKKYKTTKKVAENAKAYLSNGKKVSKLVLELANKMVSDGYIKEQPLKIQRYISINNELLEMFGLYLAYGSSSNGKVEFAFNVTTKKSEVEKVKNIFINCFGIKDVSTRIRNKRYDVIVSSVLLEKIFSNLFGRGAYNKRIPAFLNGCEKSLMPLVKGFLRGDGHVDLLNDTISFTTISPSIAYQITSILASNNILASTNSKTRNRLSNYDMFDCKIVSAHLRRYLDATKQVGDLGSDKTRKNKPNFIETDTHFFVPIISINEIAGEQEVYDLCVENSHSFVGNGIVCHNTFSEAAATKTPIIAPYSTSFIEMSGEGKRAYLIEELIPIANTQDNIIRQQCNYIEVADWMIYLSEGFLGKNENIDFDTLHKEKIDRAYDWAKSLDWKNVCKFWIEYFKETF